MTPRANTATTPRLALASPAATRALGVAVAVAFVATIAGAMRLASTRDAAAAGARDLAAVRADLRDLDAWHATSRADARDADPELTRRVRRAATAARIGDQLASIEPGPPTRDRDAAAGVTRTPIYLRLDGVTVRQVATFVAALTGDDASLRATGIEFSAPPAAVRSAAAAAAGEESWTADVMLSESTLAAAQASR